MFVNAPIAVCLKMCASLHSYPLLPTITVDQDRTWCNSTLQKTFFQRKFLCNCYTNGTVYGRIFRPYILTATAEGACMYIAYPSYTVYGCAFRDFSARNIVCAPRFHCLLPEIWRLPCQKYCMSNIHTYSVSTRSTVFIIPCQKCCSKTLNYCIRL